MKWLLLVALSALSFGSVGIEKSQMKDWQEDLSYYAEQLPKLHIDPFHAISQQTFTAEIERLKKSLSGLSRNQLLVELMRLTHRIDDGHTSFPLWGAELHRFPVDLKVIGSKIYVVKTTADYQHLLGAELVAIDNTPSQQVYSLLSQLTPFTENTYSAKVRVAQYMPRAEVLNGLGIIDESLQATFTFKQGEKSLEQVFKAKRKYDFEPGITYLNTEYFSVEEKINDDLWFGSSPDKNTVYVHFHRYASVSEIMPFGEDLLAFINKHRSEKLIIDLRDNFGGDFFVGLVLASSLVLADTIDWKSGVYVLTDNVTFSAAMSNAAQYSQLLNATLVGEPTGATPSGYQDMGQFELPHSKLPVTYSKRLYHFKEDQKEALYPDVLVEVTLADYLSNNDRQLNWILKDIAK